MSDSDEEKVDYIARFGSQVVTQADLLTELKYRSSWYLIWCALERKIIDELIDHYEIELSEDEVYEFMDSYREKNDLYSEEEISTWLRNNNMDDDEFLEFCRHEASAVVLKTKIFTNESIEEAFAYRKLQMDAVELYHILVANLDLAQEILAQIREGAGFFGMVWLKFAAAAFGPPSPPVLFFRIWVLFNFLLLGSGLRTRLLRSLFPSVGSPCIESVMIAPPAFAPLPNT